MTDRVYIVTEFATGAERYHKYDDCATLTKSDPTSITLQTAERNDLTACKMCLGRETRSGLAGVLQDMDPNVSLRGGDA